MNKHKLGKSFVLLLISSFMFMTGCTKQNDPIPEEPKEPKFYEVIFYVDDVEYKKEVVEEGSVVILPPEPVKEGYEFIGWLFNGNNIDLTLGIHDNYMLDAGFRKLEKFDEIFIDTSFKDGFNLKSVTTVKPDTVRILTTDNVDETPKWQMAQWWTKYDMQFAEYKKFGNVHIYENESHTVKIDTNNNSIYMKLLASKEYDRPRLNGENWPHILIEQNLSHFPIIKYNKVIVSLDFNILRCENMMKESEYNPNYHAGQFLWYLTLRNTVPADSNPEEVGRNGEFFWFGIPLYDSRCPNGINSSQHIDQGFVGATNKLIYSISSRSYLTYPFNLNQTYHIEFDVLPYLIEAYAYGKMNGALVNCQWENMCLGYMNLGWELPGTFDVESIVSNISVRGYYEE